MINKESLLQAYETLKKYSAILETETLNEWNAKDTHTSNDEVVFPFTNHHSYYIMNVILPANTTETQDSVKKYLDDNSNLFSHFAHEDFDMKTPLFDVRSYVFENSRVIDFRPKKMNVYHSTLWGADVLSDEPVPTEHKNGEELTPYGKFMIDLKVKVDRWNVVTGYFIICNGVAYAYPMNQYKEDMRRAMLEEQVDVVDFYSEPFNY